jgi:hypothetical protein
MRKKPHHTPSRLALSTAVAAAFLTGYGGRKSYAGSCTGAGGIYSCSGPATAADTSQILAAPDLTVTTNPGFGIDTTVTGGDAFQLTGNGVLVFTDNNFSTITGDDSGIEAGQSGATGSLTITTTGTVIGANAYGIFALNQGTDLTINTAEVYGSGGGILAGNFGTGALSITSTDTVGGFYGIYAVSYGTDLTIKTVAVSDSFRGIRAVNYGTGALSITSTGAVSSFEGIIGVNYGTDLTINTAEVYGRDIGIVAVNYGTGALSVTSTGTVTGSRGILAVSYGTDLTINTAAVSAGTGGGILAYNYGTGALSITSTGAVTATTAPGIGIVNDSTGPTIINTADSVTGSVGISVVSRLNSSPAIITSHGTITGTGGFAIDLRDNGNDVINLGPGSAIVGAIDFGNGNDGLGGTNPDDIDTLNVRPGFNGVITFVDSSGTDSAMESAPEIYSSNVAVFDNGPTATAVAVDPSGFAASGLFMSELTNSIFNTLYDSTTAPGGFTGNDLLGASTFGLTPYHRVSAIGERRLLGLGAPGASGHSNGVSTLGETDRSGLSSGPQYWMAGFAGHQDVESNSIHADMDHDFSGVMLGLENASDNHKHGLFAGYGRSEVDIEDNAGSTDTASFFAGGYLKKDYGSHSIHLGLIAGSADQDLKRNVTGTTPETAKGNADGWFISPSVTLAAPVNWAPVPLVASARASYTGLFLDDYTEKDTAYPLDVSDRHLHLLNARLQLASSDVYAHTDGSHSLLEIRAGLDAQSDLDSDDVSAVVGGESINFSASIDDEVSGFLGASINHVSTDKRFIFGAFGEAQFSDDGDRKMVGGLRMRLKF